MVYQFFWWLAFMTCVMIFSFAHVRLGLIGQGVIKVQSMRHIYLLTFIGITALISCILIAVLTPLR